MPDISKIMQQAQKMQQKLKEQQEEIANKEISGESGAGLVKLTMNGRHEAKKIQLDDSIVPGVSAEDKEMLEDLICAAINDASHKIEETAKDSMSGLASGFKLPPGLDTLFK